VVLLSENKYDDDDYVWCKLASWEVNYTQQYVRFCGS